MKALTNILVINKYCLNFFFVKIFTIFYKKKKKNLTNSHQTWEKSFIKRFLRLDD